MAEKMPFLGVPQGDVTVLNADGTYRGDHNNHSLYDTKGPLAEPQIPGDWDNTREVNRQKP